MSTVIIGLPKIGGGVHPSRTHPPLNPPLHLEDQICPLSTSLVYEDRDDRQAQSGGAVYGWSGMWFWHNSIIGFKKKKKNL